MKIIFYLLLLSCYFSLAQVGIGNTNPQAAIDITSIDSGMLIPRVELVDTADTVTVTNPDGTALIKSTLVYNTITRNDVSPAFYYWNGVDTWLRLLVAGDNEDVWKANPTDGRVEIDKLSDGITDRPNNNVYITDESQLIIDQVTTNNDNGGSRKIQVYNGDIANYSNIPSKGAFGFIGHKSRGTIDTPTAVLPGDDVSGYFALSYNGTDYVTSSYLEQGVSPSWDGTSPEVLGNFQFRTTSPGIEGEKMRLTYDGKLGINTPSPTEVLEIHGNAGNNWDADLDAYSYSSNITSFHIRSASGNRYSLGSLNGKTNANIFNIEAQGYDGDQFITASSIKLGVTATADVSDNVMPGKIVFATRPNGVNSLRDRMVIDANGNLGIGTLTGLTEKLVVNGKIKATDINFTGIPSFNNQTEADAATTLEVGDVYRIGNDLKIKIP